jgi:leader peptidase (prepilin peptidase)/N-methyltransferase
MGVAVAAATLAGLLGGLLVPAAAYRLSVPAGEPLRTGCPVCNQPVGWWRCPHCGARVGPPRWLTAVTAGVASGLVALALGPDPVLPLYVAMCVLGVLLGAVDLVCQRLPHQVVVPAIWVSLAGFTVVAAVTGEWSNLLRATLGAAVLGGAFLVLFLLPGQGLGFGDVKLAVLLGGFLGWVGWSEVLLGALLPWLVNAPVVLYLLLRGKVSRKVTMPFGPAMLVGAVLSLLVGAGLDLFARIR